MQSMISLYKMQIWDRNFKVSSCGMFITLSVSSSLRQFPWWRNPNAILPLDALQKLDLTEKTTIVSWNGQFLILTRLECRRSMSPVALQSLWTGKNSNPEKRKSIRKRGINEYLNFFSCKCLPLCLQQCLGTGSKCNVSLESDDDFLSILIKLKWASKWQFWPYGSQQPLKLRSLVA